MPTPEDRFRVLETVRDFSGGFVGHMAATGGLFSAPFSVRTACGTAEAMRRADHVGVCPAHGLTGQVCHPRASASLRVGRRIWGVHGL